MTHESQFVVELLSLRDLLNTPEPAWLIQDFIHEREVGVIYGPANVGKSFVLVDWALSVATGCPWLGVYQTKQTPVLYMAGEGATSLNKRVDAWLRVHQQVTAPIYFQTRPLPLREAQVIADIQEALCFAYEDPYGNPSDVRPGLIIVDTLSQFMMGGDENGSDMALFVANLRHLSQEQNAAIVIVHHTNKGGIAERGHTALRGNVDVMFSLSGKEKDGQLDLINLVNDKQRDDVRAKPVGIKVLRSHKSLVLSLNVSIDLPGLTMEIPHDFLIKLLIDGGLIADTDTGSFHHSEWLLKNGSSRTSFDRNVHKLMKMKLVKKYKGNHYDLTTSGIETFNHYRQMSGK